MAGKHAAQDAGAAAYVPTGHEVAVYAQEAAPAGLCEPARQGACVAFVEPGGQKKPALQGPSQEDAVRPEEEPKRPAAQGAWVALVEPAGQ